MKHLALLRFALVNVIALAFVGAAWFQGAITYLWEADHYYFVTGISCTFLLGWLETAWVARKIDREMAALLAYQNNWAGLPTPEPLARLVAVDTAGSRNNVATMIRLSLSSRLMPARFVANSLVLLGLVGTVIGFMIALSGVDPAKAGDVGAIAPMVATLIDGMAVALHTTLAGSLFYLWITVCLRVLEDETIRLLTGTIEQAESDASA